MSTDPINLDEIERGLAPMGIGSTLLPAPNHTVLEIVRLARIGMRSEAVTDALRVASTYAEEYVRDHGGIDGCDMQDRIALERIRAALNGGPDNA